MAVILPVAFAGALHIPESGLRELTERQPSYAIKGGKIRSDGKVEQSPAPETNYLECLPAPIRAPSGDVGETTSDGLPASPGAIQGPFKSDQGAR